MNYTIHFAIPFTLLTQSLDLRVNEREREREGGGERERERPRHYKSLYTYAVHTQTYTHTKKLESRVLSVSCAYLLLDTPADPRRETACLACRAVILGRALTASCAVLDIS